MGPIRFAHNSIKEKYSKNSRQTTDTQAMLKITLITSVKSKKLASDIKYLVSNITHARAEELAFRAWLNKACAALVEVPSTHDQHTPGRW